MAEINRSMADTLSATVAEWDSQRIIFEPLIRQLEAAKNDDEFRAILKNANISGVDYSALDHITDCEVLMHP
jgi:hypothetical protein